MRWYTWRFEVGSPLLTPPQADTLFGHVCWALRYRQGEKALEEFLGEFANEPPLVLGQMFPGGWLPAPICEVPVACRIYGKPRVPLVRLETVLAGGLWSTDLRGEMERAQAEGTWPDAREIMSPRNSVDRMGGGTLERGGFYQVQETHYPRGQILDLHFLAKDVNRAAELIRGGLAGGFGADKSIGRGVLVPLGKPEEVPLPGHGGRRMALAGFVPASASCPDLEGSTFTKFGRLGGAYASGINPRLGVQKPFKKPIIMMAPGATVAEGPEVWTGTLLGGVHSDERIRHNALTPLLPLGRDANREVGQCSATD